MSQNLSTCRRDQFGHAPVHLRWFFEFVVEICKYSTVLGPICLCDDDDPLNAWEMAHSLTRTHKHKHTYTHTVMRTVVPNCQWVVHVVWKMTRTVEFNEKALVCYFWWIVQVLAVVTRDGGWCHIKTNPFLKNNSYKKPTRCSFRPSKKKMIEHEVTHSTLLGVILSLVGSPTWNIVLDWTLVWPSSRKCCPPE